MNEIAVESRWISPKGAPTILYPGNEALELSYTVFKSVGRYIPQEVDMVVLNLIFLSARVTMSADRVARVPHDEKENRAQRAVQTCICSVTYVTMHDVRWQVYCNAAIRRWKPTEAIVGSERG
jgi:hypothetical protein